MKDKLWRDALSDALNEASFIQLQHFIKAEREAGKIIFPDEQHVFNAFELTKLDDVKVVVLGQDPYHGAGQAHGLSFSVQDGVAIPPSLRNIYKEIADDVYANEIEMPTSGNLEHWAKQGVLLLNAVLTVEEAQPNSHQDKGWEAFTDAVIRCVSEQCDGVIFLLWGAYAKKKKALIDVSRHHILMSAHPSPLSAYRGFLGCHHFSQLNQLLVAQDKSEIQWFSEEAKKVPTARKLQYDLL